MSSSSFVFFCFVFWGFFVCFFPSELDSIKHLEPWWKQIHWFGLSFVLHWLAKCLEGGVESCISFHKPFFFPLSCSPFSLYLSPHCSGGGLLWFSKQCAVLKAHKFTGFNYKTDNLEHQMNPSVPVFISFLCWYLSICETIVQYYCNLIRNVKSHAVNALLCSFPFSLL